MLDPSQERLRSSLVGSLTSLYAAVPSLRSAYAILIGITGYRASRHLVPRLLWALYPALVVFATVATGTHLAAGRRSGGRRPGDRLDDGQPAARRSSAASCAARPRREIGARPRRLRPRTAGVPFSERVTSARVARSGDVCAVAPPRLAGRFVVGDDEVRRCDQAVVVYAPVITDRDLVPEVGAR